MTDPYRTEDERAARAKLLESQSQILEGLSKLTQKLGVVQSKVERLDMPDDIGRTTRWGVGMFAIVATVFILKMDSCAPTDGVDEIDACGRLCAEAGVKKVTLDEDYHRVELCECNAPEMPR